MIKRLEILPDVWLNAVQTDKFKTGFFSINLVRPLCHEEVSKNALLAGVLMRGSEKYPDMRKISDRLNEMYGAYMSALIRKYGDVQTTGFFADFAEDALAGAPIFASVMDFVSQVLLHPLTENGAFLPEIVESEKQNLRNAIEARINDKRAYAVSELRRRMCEGEAFRIDRTGDPEDVACIDERNLYAHYLEILKTSRIELFYMGRKSAAEAAEILRNALRELPRSAVVRPETVVVRSAGEVREFTQTMDVTQGKLVMGFRTGCAFGEPECPAVILMNAIFGSGMTSKLFLKVREEMSLCYYASSAVNNRKGILFVSSGIEFSKYDIARREILHQLDECRQGNITETELQSARRYLLSDLRAGMDSPGKLDDFYVGQAIGGLSGSMEDLAQQLAAVTKEQIVAAANRVQLDTVFFLKGETA